MTSIFVRYPQFYWLADPECFPGLTQDPDLTDRLNRPRHSDKCSVNWSEVGAVVQDIGKRLVAGQYREYHDDPEKAEVAVTYGNLSKPEIEIVNRWFEHGVCPSGDPERLENGRHRLWNCWSANKDLMLPVESTFLCYTLEPDDSSVHDALPCEARAKLNAVSDAVRERSTAYVDRLIQLSSRCVVDDPDDGDSSSTTFNV
ncbi:hypothetical protein FRC0314_01664 [Corynebacterium diphtheriae]|nr:hypothetical protein FRC0314_01664 [Corynebacterium diphtheriae]